MMNFIENSNLPEKRVKAVICGSDDANIINFFNKKGIEVLQTMPNFDIAPAVATHADMAVLHLGAENIILDRRQAELKNKLQRIGMTVYETDEKISGSYPNDIKLNFAVLGNQVIGNFKYADKQLRSLVFDKYKIDVRQGYCKCSVLVVKKNAVITDDESTHRKMSQNGIDSLLISKGDISLHGHEYGFIGGASGKISSNDVVFFGDIKKHRDFEVIKAFLSKYECNFLCTDESPLRDIGGIIPILEKN